MDVWALQGALHQHSGCLGSQQALGALGAVPASPPVLLCPRGLPLGVGCNDVPIYLYQMNVIFCPDKRGQSLKAQFHFEMSHPG